MRHQPLSAASSALESSHIDEGKLIYMSAHTDEGQYLFSCQPTLLEPLAVFGKLTKSCSPVIASP